MNVFYAQSLLLYDTKLTLINHLKVGQDSRKDAKRNFTQKGDTGMWLIDQMYSKKAKKKSTTRHSWAAEARQYMYIKK
jgi:hypothetical protein